MNIHPDSKDSLSLNLLIGGNSPDAKSLAVLAALDISASIIASAPLPRSRWVYLNRGAGLHIILAACNSLITTNPYSRK